jgi:hypothetical protein
VPQGLVEIALLTGRLRQKAVFVNGIGYRNAARIRGCPRLRFPRR